MGKLEKVLQQIVSYKDPTYSIPNGQLLYRIIDCMPPRAEVLNNNWLTGVPSQD